MNLNIDSKHPGALPLPEGDRWDNLGANVRRIALRRRQRVRSLALALLCISALSAVVVLTTWSPDTGSTTVAGRGGPTMRTHSAADNTPVNAGSRPPDTHDPTESLLAEVNLLTLQMQIDQMALSVRRSGLEEYGVTDRDIWTICGVTPEEVLASYTRIL